MTNSRLRTAFGAAFWLAPASPCRPRPGFPWRPGRQAHFWRQTKRKHSLALFASALAFALAASAAFAHAQLQRAVPPVGGTVSSPSEIRLEFNEGVEPKFSGLTLSAQGGGAQALGAPSVDASDNKALIVKIFKALAPGVYTVNWHVVSVDTHHTQGSFQFTVK